MTKQQIPFFEVNGKKYEIKRNRYLMAETEKMKSEINLSNEEQVELAKEEEKSAALEKLSKRKEELYAKYLETFSEEDEEMYNKACAAQDRLLDEIAQTKNISGQQAKKVIDIGEKMIIVALQKDETGKTIRTEEEATEIWENYVNECGTIAARDFVIYTMNYILGAEQEEENPFVAQAKARAEQRANMKKGIGLAK